MNFMNCTMKPILLVMLFCFRIWLFSLLFSRYSQFFCFSIYVFLLFDVLLLYVGALANFKNLLDRDDLPPQWLSYDTTFNMGDFYLSVLVYRETEFESTPVIPLLYLIHERKWESVHDFFFKRLTELVPELNSQKRILIATDEEKAIVAAAKKHLPDIPRVPS